MWSIKINCDERLGSHATLTIVKQLSRRLNKMLMRFHLRRLGRGRTMRCQMDYEFRRSERSKVHFRRYEFSDLGCRHKIFRDVTFLFDFLTFHGLGLGLRYFLADDAEQTFLIHIKHAGA